MQIQTAQAQVDTSRIYLFLVVIVFALGWVVYGTAAAGGWVVAMWIALNLTSLIGMIPVAGPVLYWNIATGAVVPFLSSVGHLDPSWLTTVAIWYGVLNSLICTIISTHKMFASP